jgi:hypothetical protein
MKTSVTIPTINRSLDLKKSPRSISGNIHQPDEVIIMEQGDIIATNRVVSVSDVHVVAVHQENNSLTQSRNLGLGNSFGGTIMFIDDIELSSDYIAIKEECFSIETSSSIIRAAGKGSVQSTRLKVSADYLGQVSGAVFWCSTLGKKNSVLASGHNVLRNTYDTECEAEWFLGDTKDFNKYILR